MSSSDTPDTPRVTLALRESAPDGQAAWPDRPMTPQEPSVLYQTMSPAAAAEAIERLDGRGYWQFYRRNTGKGYFDVSTSKSVHSSMRID